MFTLLNHGGRVVQRSSAPSTGFPPVVHNAVKFTAVNRPSVAEPDESPGHVRPIVGGEITTAGRNPSRHVWRDRLRADGEASPGPWVGTSRPNELRRRSRPRSH